MDHFYPVLLDLRGRRCVVAGGGKVAERKIQALLTAGGDVVVVSPAVTENIERLRDGGKLRVLLREFAPSDLQEASLAFACTDSPEVNEQVYQHARQRGIFVNIADRPDLGTMRNMASFHRGRLQISVATGGVSPGLAKSIIRKLEADFGPEFAEYLDFLDELREWVKRTVTDADARRRILASALEWGILEQIRSGAFKAKRDLILRDILADFRSMGEERENVGGHDENNCGGHPPERAGRHPDRPGD